MAATAVLLIVVGAWALHYFGRPAITTALGEQRTLNLPDGTRVELNTQSRLVVRFDDRVRTVVLTSGEAYFNVAHEARPFVVVAGPRKVIAVGTSFLVRREEGADNAVTVTLIEGRVAVAPLTAADALPSKPTPEVTLLSAGKRLKAAQHAPPAIDSPSIDKETAWMRGQLIFDSTPLREAAAEFNRYNALQIKIASTEAGAIPVGGVFRTGDSASFAAAVAQAHNLQLVTRENELVLESIQ
jgi:transmembrane sensor